MEIKNHINGKIIKGYDGLKCDKCGSHNTKTVTIITHDSEYSFNEYINECKDCKNKFKIQDR